MSCNHGCKKNFLPMRKKDVQQEPPDKTEQLHKSKHLMKQNHYKKVKKNSDKNCIFIITNK